VRQIALNHRDFWAMEVVMSSVPVSDEMCRLRPVARLGSWEVEAEVRGVGRDLLSLL